MKYIILFLITSNIVLADDYTIAIVKLFNVNVQKENRSGLAYKVNNYKKGKILELEYCDKYDWCKIKNKEL